MSDNLDSATSTTIKAVTACFYCDFAGVLQPVGPALLRCPDCGSLHVRADLASRPRPAVVAADIREITQNGVLNGKYLLQGKLGEGAQGAAYLARHTLAGHDCVIKFSHEHVTQPDVRRLEMIAEARLGLMVRHPNVVQVYDCDSAGGRAFIVLEYVDGFDLATLLSAASRLPAVQVVELLDSALSGLAAIHDAGILHRDIRPDNLLIDQSQQLRIADLGVATLAEAGTGNATNGVMPEGSIAYAAPEVLEAGAQPNVAGDLYMLGATAFALLTGAPPRSQSGVFSRLLPQDDIRWPDEVVTDSPQWLRTLIEQMIGDDPAARPQSATDIRLRIAVEQDRSVSQFVSHTKKNTASATAAEKATESAQSAAKASSVKSSSAEQEKFATYSAYFADGAFEKARVIMTELIAMDDANPEYHGALGIVQARLGQYDAAEASYAQQIQLATSQNEPRWLIEAYANLGTMHYHRGAVEQARSAFEQAVAEAERSDATTQRAQILNNLGFVYTKLGLTNEAENAFREAISIHKNNGAKLPLIGPYNGLGTVFAETGNHQEAEANFQAALAVAQEVRDRPNAGMTYVHLGNLRQKQGHYAAAMQEYSLALSALEGTKAWSSLTRLYDAMAELNLQIDQPAEAVRCTDRLIEHAQSQKNKRAEAAAWLQRSRALQKMGDDAGVDASLAAAEQLGAADD